MKKVAIMQPYFFPYLGYFGLMNCVDEFILLDDVQFMRHGWIERNRIIKQQGGWLYLSVPLNKHHQKAPINIVNINETIDWRKKILDQLVVYKKLAPHYFRTRNWIEQALHPPFVTIADLNFHLLKEIKNFLGIQCEIKRFNETSKILSNVKEPDDWALEICKLYHEPVHYINPEGGLSFFNKEKYLSSGIPISFFKQNLVNYHQGNQRTFEPALSIIDIMMFNSIEEIKNMMQNFELL